MAICRYRAADFREIRQRLREELKEQEEGSRYVKTTQTGS
jgi:hypothetical protein